MLWIVEAPPEQFAACLCRALPASFILDPFLRKFLGSGFEASQPLRQIS